jgi:hypothetical protein
MTDKKGKVSAGTFGPDAIFTFALFQLAYVNKDPNDGSLHSASFAYICLPRSVFVLGSADASVRCELQFHQRNPNRAASAKSTSSPCGLVH